MSRHSSKHSINANRKSSVRRNEEDDDAYLEECEGIYLSVMQNLEEEISSPEELILLLQHAGYNPSKKTLEKYWGPSIDSYDFDQFCSIVKQEKKPTKKDLLKAFQKIDRNGDGYITHDELFQVLTKRGERMTKSEVKMMIEDADFNGDGKLDYEEFCDMMDATSKQCRQFYATDAKPEQKQSFGKKASLNDVVPPQRGKPHRNLFNVKEEKRSSVMQDERGSEKKTSRSSITSKLSAKEQKKNDEAKDEMKRTVAQKLKHEPQDLNRWQFHSTKGCFYKEDNGKIESHHYQMKITQPTTVWITIKPAPPKYGKFNDEILESDMMLFLVDESHGNKLVAFSNSLINGKYCLQADVNIGVYNLLSFSSGNKLYAEESDSGQVSLVKGRGEDAKLTKPCRDTLMEIFYRCDLDGNGYLSQEEFNEFQMRASGEGCDDEAWDVVKETIEVTPQFEITPNGFMNLNLMEARDPDGGQDELWITIESMGYTRKLQLTKACPFQVEVYTKRGKNDITLLGVSDGGAPLQNALMESIKAISTVTQIRSKRDLLLHIAQFENRISVAVDNQSHSIVGIQVDCTGSENLISNQGSLENVEDIDPKSMTIIHHLTPERKSETMSLKYQESVIR